MRGSALAVALGTILAAVAPARTFAQQAAQAVGPQNTATPALINYVAPAYPSVALLARITGIVEFEAALDADGRVVQARAIRQLQFQQTKLQALAAQLIAVDRSSAREVRLQAMPFQEVRQTAAGIDVRITAEPPVVFVQNSHGPAMRGHALDVWTNGEWHRLGWTDMYRQGAPIPSHEGLARIGAFIRETVAQKPGVRELWGDQRECLPPQE